MPLRQESYLTEAENNDIIGDLIETVTKKSFPAFLSKDELHLLAAYPLADQSNGKVFGEITTLVKSSDEKIEIIDCDLTIDNKNQSLHFINRLPASSEANEYYTVALPDTDIRFVIETVNRYAVWDDKIENQDLKVRLSAFAFRILVHDNIEAYNKSIGFSPFDSKIGQVVGLSEVFCMPKDEETKNPYTFFLGTVKDIKDVKTKLTKKFMEFSIIFVECFSGILPVVVSKKLFDLSKLQKGKLVEISASIKADLGADATPKAVV